MEKELSPMVAKLPSMELSAGQDILNNGVKCLILGKVKFLA